MRVSKEGFLICPKCGRKTRVKVQSGTVLKQFPLFCHWCREEMTIEYP